MQIELMGETPPRRIEIAEETVSISTVWTTQGDVTIVYRDSGKKAEDGTPIWAPVEQKK